MMTDRLDSVRKTKKKTNIKARSQCEYITNIISKKSYLACQVLAAFWRRKERSSEKKPQTNEKRINVTNTIHLYFKRGGREYFLGREHAK